MLLISKKAKLLNQWPAKIDSKFLVLKVCIVGFVFCLIDCSKKINWGTFGRLRDTGLLMGENFMEALGCKHRRCKCMVHVVVASGVTTE